MSYVKDYIDSVDGNAHQSAVEIIEKLEDRLNYIQQWSKAYPLSAFPEPDFEKAAKVLKKVGMTIDAISASNMRYVLKQIEALIDESPTSDEKRLDSK